jgi:hypothetical protein
VKVSKRNFIDVIATIALVATNTKIFDPAKVSMLSRAEIIIMGQAKEFCNTVL